MVYTRELKYQICKRIFDGEITIKEASVECGATLATIKKWVKLYTADPSKAFKKKDIEGGVEKANAILVIGIAVISFIGRSTRTDVARLSDYNIPVYDSQTYEVLNNNVPFFNPKDYGLTVFEEYAELDAYGRCGVAFANICHELMPTEARGE